MYCNLNDAYNNDCDDLDRMAREINDKKKIQLNSCVNNDRKYQQQKWEHDIMQYNNNNYTPFMKFNNQTVNNLNDDISELSSINTPTIDSLSIDSPDLDSYIDSIKLSPKNKLNKFIYDIDTSTCSISKKKYKTRDEMFKHIKNCFDCRERIIKQLKLKYSEDSEETNSANNEIHVKNESLFGDALSINKKEILLVTLLGIVIMYILDFLIKPRNGNI